MQFFFLFCYIDQQKKKVATKLDFILFVNSIPMSFGFVRFCEEIAKSSAVMASYGKCENTGVREYERECE